MVWHTVQCPECGRYMHAQPTPGEATAAWREHFVTDHLAQMCADHAAGSGT